MSFHVSLLAPFPFYKTVPSPFFLSLSPLLFFFLSQTFSPNPSSPKIKSCKSNGGLQNLCSSLPPFVVTAFHHRYATATTTRATAVNSQPPPSIACRKVRPLFLKKKEGQRSDRKNQIYIAGLKKDHFELFGIWTIIYNECEIPIFKIKIIYLFILLYPLSMKFMLYIFIWMLIVL